MPTTHVVFIHFFFFNTTSPTDIYTLSLHDALPICQLSPLDFFYDTVYRGGAIPVDIFDNRLRLGARLMVEEMNEEDRKSTRLNSSHTVISYAVFCLKKKKKKKNSNK